MPRGALRLVCLLCVACGNPPADSFDVVVPESSDWIDCGPILAAGKPGEWDAGISGAFALSPLLRGDSIFLYYQGARGYDEEGATVTWRAIGVAVSPDGLRFEKYSENPVLTWSPRQNLEEGAVSSAAFADRLGRVVMYYGANTWAGGQLVNADGRLATSTDGYTFTDQGIALDHTSRRFWGAGDELFPIMAFQHGGRTIVYYVPNGTLQRRQLGVAWGEGRYPERSAAARTRGATVRAWGSGSVVQVGRNLYALFYTAHDGGEERHVQVRTVSADRPYRLSPPVAKYHVEGMLAAAVLLDTRRAKWFMYYRVRGSREYRVKVAGRRKPEQWPLDPLSPHQSADSVSCARPPSPGASVQRSPAERVFQLARGRGRVP